MRPDRRTPVLGALATADAYDACLADADDQARFDCMRAELESIAGVCDEAFSCPGCI